MTQQTQAFGLSQIGQIAIRTKDFSRAVAFYRDTLGMRFLFQAPPQLAFFDCGGVRLLLGSPEDKEFDHPGSVLYYKVDDITAAHEALGARGVQFIREPHLIAKMPDHDLWMAFFHDSEDNTLALMSEVRA
jgi:predicted enzyme related to lactoylglutathione lyase